MTEYGNNQEYIEKTVDEIDVFALFSKLWNERKYILKWLLGALICGLIVGWSIPKEYSSSVVLASESASSTSMGNLGSLAAMAGVRLGSNRQTDSFSTELYPDILSSTPFVTDLFPSPVSFKKKGELQEMDLYSYALDYLKMPWWKTVLLAPKRFISLVKRTLSGGSKPVNGYEGLDPSRLTSEQNKVFKRLKSRISISTNKNTNAITITAKMQNPSVAAQVADKVMENLKQYVVKYRTDKSVKDMQFTEHLYNEARDKYYASQKKYALYQDAHQGMVLQSVRTEQERLRNEMELDYQLYNSISRDLQMSRAKVQEETPVFTLLQPAVVPHKAVEPSKTMIIIFFLFLGFCIPAAWILLGRDFVEKLKKQTQE